MSQRRHKVAMVRVSGGGEVGTSIASLAALVCAPHDGLSPDERERRELEALEEAVLLQLAELRAHRDRAARR